MKPIEAVLKSTGREGVISVSLVVVKLAFTSDTVSQKMLTKDVLKSLKLLCAHKDPEYKAPYIEQRAEEMQKLHEERASTILKEDSMTKTMNQWRWKQL